MIITIIFIGACVTLFTPRLLKPLVKVAHPPVTHSSQSTLFIHQLLPLIIKADQQILRDRQGILSLQKIWRQRGALTITEHYWLRQVTKQYRTPIPTSLAPSFWPMLLQRIDIIPPSMVLAQAAIESAWGTSRFAQQGNNLFGQHCHTQGCGIVPNARAKGATFEVSIFPTRFDAIVAYMNNLNTNRHYKPMRQLRHSLRQAHKPLTGLVLIAGLTDYSSKKHTYIQIIQQTIKRYQLQQYDTF